MKKLTAALAALLFLFAGCTSLHENNNIADLPSLAPHETQPGEEKRTVNAALYFPDAKTKKLVAEMRELEIGAEEDVGGQLLQALFRGPRDSSLTVLGSGLELADLEITEEIANVYVTSPQPQTLEQQFILVRAVADTVIDYFGVKYVCVYINGQIFTMDGVPCGPMTKSDGDVPSLYRQYVSKYSDSYAKEEGGARETNIVLYFMDPSGRYILPEVRRVSFSGENYVQEILEQLAIGPTYKTYLTGFMQGEFTPSQQMREIPSQTVNRRYLSFDEMPFASGSGDNMAALSCLYYTLAGFLSNTEQLTCEIEGSPKVMTRDIAKEYLGETVTIYYPNVNLTSLKAVSRTVRESASESVRTYLEELVRGPIEVDAEDVWPAFPEGITMEDILGAEIHGSTLTINFSGNFRTQMEKMSDKKLRLLVYSIVNTVSRMDTIRDVQFLFEGERVEKVGGYLNLYSPLMPNPGLQQ